VYIYFGDVHGMTGLHSELLAGNQAKYAVVFDSQISGKRRSRFRGEDE
jgi:hypothetical protein